MSWMWKGKRPGAKACRYRQRRGWSRKEIDCGRKRGAVRGREFFPFYIECAYFESQKDFLSWSFLHVVTSRFRKICGTSDLPICRTFLKQFWKILPWDFKVVSETLWWVLPTDRKTSLNRFELRFQSTCLKRLHAVSSSRLVSYSSNVDFAAWTSRQVSLSCISPWATAWRRCLDQRRLSCVHG